MSYPEQYFMELFALYDIPLQYHKQISYYELDFYNDEHKVYVEIDGEQHYQPQSIIRDQKRTEFLERKGWRCIRIRWSEWQKYSLTEKQNVLNDIKDMLK
jgi:very-short-patch-repair endonuclease